MILISSLAIITAILLYTYYKESRIFLALFQWLCFRPREGAAVHIDKQQYFPAYAEIERCWMVIRDELDAVMAANNTLPRLHEVDPANKKISFANGPAWNTIILKAYDGWFHDNCDLFPETYRLLKSVPHVPTVMLSILAPHAKIPPHTGKFAGIYRYHLALRVPAAASQCYIKVASETYHWEEGTGVLFNDTYLHSVTNNTDEVRAVLFLDVRKSMSPFADKLSDLLMSIVRRSPVFKNALRTGIISTG